MGHSLNRTNISINQNLVIDDNTFNPGYILISDEKGNVSWKNPSGYIDQTEPLDHFIGELYGGGIVVAAWREVKETIYEKCLIAATRDYGEFSSGTTYYGYSWGLLNIGTSSRYFSFGASNSAAIGATASISNPMPAAEKALSYVNEDLYGLGVYGDWYLPSIHELNCLSNNAAIVNRVIAQYASDKSIRLYDQGGLGASMSLFCNARPTRDFGGGYWTSTEYDANNAYYLNMDALKFGLANKGSAYNVRPFRLETKRWSGSEWIILDPASRRKTGKVLVTHDQPVVEELGPSIVANITAMEQSLSNTVIYATYSQIISQDLSQYDHIWDIGVDITYALNNQLTTIMGATYTAYLQQGGAMFILGENAGFNPRNTDVVNFINSLGGGTVAPPSTTNSSTLTVGSQFLLANTTNTVSFNAGGVFASIGTGTSITSPSTVAAVWQKGSLSAAPNACIVSILDINWLSSEWTNRNSSQFAANVSKILNQL